MAFSILQVLTLILITLALALALAHALELPGKMRLSRETYFAVQPIYYPGFTIGGGIGEAGGTILTILVLVFTPIGSAAFWLTLVALLGLIGMQAVYWLFTHHLNQVWLKGEKLSAPGFAFFAFGAKAGQQGEGLGWTAFRDRWECSHVIRAGFAFVSFLAMVISLLFNQK